MRGRIFACIILSATICAGASAQSPADRPAAVVNGVPLDMSNIGNLVQIALTALAAFIAAHGSYTLFWKKS